ncbi:MAG: DNA polymerase I [Desulfovibrio sp.]
MALSDKILFDKKPIFLIDGSAFIYRGFYAYPDLKRSDGFPTNAIFIVLRILLRILREEQPEHLAFFIDGKGKTFRNDLYDEYKANRPKMPEPLAEQIEPLKEAVSLFGLHLHVTDGVEADDCIASLAARFKKERPVVIVGADKDLRQCLDDNVYLWDPAGKKEKFTTLEDFTEETGLTPAQWPDYQALIGDSADNIPGIPGVGPKTADKIMAECPTLEDLKEGYTKLAPKLAKKVEDHLEKIFIYRDLTRMKTDCCTGTPAEEYRVQTMDVQAAADYLKTYEFRSLHKELLRFAGISDGLEADTPKSATPSKGKKAAAKKGTPQLSLFDMGGTAPAAKKEDLEPAEIQKVEKISELPPAKSQLVGIVRRSKGFHIGIGGKEYLYTGREDFLADYVVKAKVIAVPSVHDLLRKEQAWTYISSKKWFDASLAAYLLNPEERNYDWDRLHGSLFQDSPEFADAPEVHPDAHGLGVLAFREAVMPRVEDANLTKLMDKLEIPLIPVLASMEKQGLGIDTKAFTEFLKEVQYDIDELTKEIYDKAGKSFNIRSSQQMGTILFEELGLKPGGKTSGGALSTAVSVLEKIQHQHPIVGDILKYRKLEKLRSTYLEPLPKLVGKDGRIHSNFNQLATATGRLSSSRPNLQNIPIRGPQGKRMRACFKAQDGYLLAAADYSQVELRVLTHFSKDPELVDAYVNDQDIHSRTAALLFDKELSEITSDERRDAKTINFGLIYGMGPQKLGRELGIKLNEAKAFIERYFERLSTLHDFYEGIVDKAKEHGYVTTLAGRRRLVPDILSGNNLLFSQAKRQAINTVIQGSAADIIKLAMLSVQKDEKLKELEARLILQVHDELLIEAPEANIKEAEERLCELMQNVIELSVPLKVDSGVGKTWAEAH